MTAYSGKALFALWVASIVTVAIALMIIFSAFARAAELGYCKTYANRMSALALHRLLGVPFIDVSTGRFLYRKAYTACLNSDDEPPVILSEEQQPLIDGMPTPPTRPEPVPGSVPATDPADAPVAPVAPKARAKTAKAQSIGGQPQPLCIRHGKRTVYSGHRWRCVK